MDRAGPALLLGLGNELLRDDGVGLAGARRVAAAAGDSAELVEATLATIDLLPIVRGHERLIVVDAFVSDRDPPGSTVCLAPRDHPTGFGYRSFHTLSFDEMLRLGRMLGYPMPSRVAIHGLCVEDAWTFGHDFTRPVECAWRPWADRIARQEFPGAIPAE